MNFFSAQETLTITLTLFAIIDIFRTDPDEKSGSIIPIAFQSLQEVGL
jgi:hypothetical protein